MCKIEANCLSFGIIDKFFKSITIHLLSRGSGAGELALKLISIEKKSVCYEILNCELCSIH